jgi:flagellar motor protein MotB
VWSSGKKCRSGKYSTGRTERFAEFVFLFTPNFLILQDRDARGRWIASCVHEVRAYVHVDRDLEEVKKMKQRIAVSVVASVLGTLPAIAQDRDAKAGDVPIYRITVVERNMKAINYAYRTGPTMIDFRGTVLLAKAKGQATVESRQGRTEIDAHFENLSSPQGFGLEYMTYVLWAITPEGRARNLGEVVPNSSNKSSLHVTTDLKAFGLIVTAEPHSAVRQPSDVVVAENQVREDTIGKIEEVNARYELLPRGHYTWNVSSKLQAEVANAPKVSMRKYEALLELYQAQNAIAIARSAGADRYAANTFAKAQALLTEAEQLNANKNIDSHRVVDSAREAAQTAEDAHMIAERHIQEEQIAQAAAQVAAAEQARVAAKGETERAQAAVTAAQAQLESERAARQRAEAETVTAQERARQAEADAQASRASANATATAAEVASQHVQKIDTDSQKADLRIRLLEQLNGALATRDTAWGLMATIPDRGFSGVAMHGTPTDQLRRIVQVVNAHPGLRVTIEGHSDGASTEGVASRRAAAVRDALVSCGLSPSLVEVRSMGNSRPLGPNNTESGREENRRVEIIVSGDPIGKYPYWDRPYTLSLRQ